jgi:hypothetical protein
VKKVYVAVDAVTLAPAFLWSITIAPLMMRLRKAGVFASKIAVPVFAPKLTVFVPATAGSCSVTLPLVDPSNTKLMSNPYKSTYNPT